MIKKIQQLKVLVKKKLVKEESGIIRKIWLGSMIRRRGFIFLEAVIYISIAMILITISVIMVKSTLDVRKNVEIISELKSTAIEVEDWIVEEVRNCEDMDVFFRMENDVKGYKKVDYLRYRKYSTYKDRETLKTRRIIPSASILYLAYDGSTFQIGNNMKDFYIRKITEGEEMIGADIRIVYEKQGVKYIDEFTVKK